MVIHSAPCLCSAKALICLNGHTLGALSMFYQSSNFKCSSSIKLFSSKNLDFASNPPCNWTSQVMDSLYVEPRHCQEMIHCLFGNLLIMMSVDERFNSYFSLDYCHTLIFPFLHVINKINDLTNFIKKFTLYLVFSIQRVKKVVYKFYKLI
jgi:hypothetical protein